MKLRATKTSALIAGSWSALGLMVSGRLGWFGPSADWRGAATVIIFFLVPAIVWVVGIGALNRRERWSRAHDSGHRHRSGSIRAMRQSIRARLGWHFTT